MTTKRREFKCELEDSRLADQVGICRETVNAFEAGRGGDVEIRKVLKIADYLGF